MINELRGSARSVNRDSEVKTFAVSSVLPLLLFAANREKTANARMGDTMGEIYATDVVSYTNTLLERLLTDQHSPYDELAKLLRSVHLLDTKNLKVIA